MPDAWIDGAAFDAQAIFGRRYELFDRQPVELIWCQREDGRWKYDPARQEIQVDSTYPCLLGTGATEADSFRYSVTINRKIRKHSAGLFWGYREDPATNSYTANILTANGKDLPDSTRELRLTVSHVTLQRRPTGTISTVNAELDHVVVPFPSSREAELEIEIQDNRLTRIWWAGEPVSPELALNVEAKGPLHHSGPLGVTTQGCAAFFSEGRLQINSKGN